MTNLNQLSQDIHAENWQWWHDLKTGERIDRNKGELLALIHSEISECLEGERKDLMDDHLPHRKMAEVELADAMIRIHDYAGAFGCDLEDYPASAPTDENKGQTLCRIHKAISESFGAETYGYQRIAQVKLAYAVGLIRAYAEKHGYDLDGAMQEKRLYNRIRADHKKEARLAGGGKKF